MTLEEEAKKPKITAKFVRIPMIIHTVIKRDTTFSLTIEHVQIYKTTINLPKTILSLKPEEIEDYIKEIYPNARSFVIQYEKRGEEQHPYCAQLFLAPKVDRKEGA
jgi:hypothetical protein